MYLCLRIQRGELQPAFVPVHLTELVCLPGVLQTDSSNVSELKIYQVFLSFLFLTRINFIQSKFSAEFFPMNLFIYTNKWCKFENLHRLVLEVWSSQSCAGVMTTIPQSPFQAEG